MEFLNENGTLILVVFTIFISILVIVTTINTYKLNRKLLSNRFTFKTFLENNIETGQNKVSIIVLNQSLLDVSITSLGIISNAKFYDFIKKYEEQVNISGDRVIIPQRSSIKLELSYGVVEDIIINNSELKKFKKVKVYAIDKSGYISKGRAKCIRDILLKKWKLILVEKMEIRKKELQAKKLIVKEDFMEIYNDKVSKKEKITFKDKILAKYYEIFYK